MENLPTAETAKAQPWLNEPLTASRHALWISGRVQTLLSHYFQPDNPVEVVEAAIDDWVNTLMHVSQDEIERACGIYLRDQPRRRPTPGDILARAQARPARPERHSQHPQGEGDRSKLTMDQQNILDNEVLPTARRWLAERPTLARQAIKTLTFWGEAIPRHTITALQDAGHLEREAKETP